MNTKLIIPLLSLFPLTASAKWNVDGTSDGDNNTYGDLQAGQYYQFGVSQSKTWKKERDIDKYYAAADPARPSVGDVIGDASHFAGVSTKTGEWWVSNTSTAPWVDYIADGAVGTQPSYHMTDDLYEGDSFFTGLSMQNQMKDYTSEFRMANDVLPVGTQVYFGLRNITQPSVLLLDGNSDPIVGNSGLIANVEGLIYQGHSIGSADTNFTPSAQVLADNSFTQQDQFEWVSYTTDNIDADVIWSIKKGKDATDILELTDWVAFFVLPDDGVGAKDLKVDNSAWPDSPPATTNDLVFSWTVDGKAGYTRTEDPDNPGTYIPLESDHYTPDGSGLSAVPVPEPSSAFLLFSGVGLMLLRRNRKSTGKTA